MFVSISMPSLIQDMPPDWVKMLSPRSSSRVTTGSVPPSIRYFMALPPKGRDGHSAFGSRAPTHSACAPLRRKAGMRCRGASTKRVWPPG